MKKLIIICLTLHILSGVKGQKISLEYGKINQYEMDYSICDFDSVAEAVVLFDIGKSMFQKSEYGFNIKFTRHKRVKILNSSGLDFAQVEIPFYHNSRNYEKINNIKACSFNFENNVPRKSELPQKDWHIEKINENWDVLKFAIPDVKAGSIIEFSYELVTPFHFHLPDWEFQDRIPIIYSAYEVRMIPFYEYISLLKGINAFDESKSYVAPGLERSFAGIPYKDKVYEFAMRNVPAFRDEELISSKNDYLIQLDFQLSKINYPTGGTDQIMSTWPEIVEELDREDEFGRFVKKSKKSADDELDMSTLLGQSAKDRFNMILDHVKQNYNWNKRYGQMADKEVKELIKDKYGSAADLNLFTVGLLQANNIEAYPVWISTRDHGKIPYDYPFTHFFNYVLIYAKVDGEIILTDATDAFLPNNRIPMRCINDLGLIHNADNKEAAWVKLNVDIPSKQYVQYKLKLNDNNNITAEINKMATEYDACNYRKEYGENEDKFEYEAKEKGYSFTPKSLETRAFDVVDKPYIISYKVNTNAVTLNDKIYVSPFLNDVISTNPLKQKIRTYPVDFTIPTIRSYTSYVSIPKGYEASYVPENIEYADDLVKIKYSTMMNEGYLICTFEYSFKKAIYFADDYSQIQEFYNQVITKGNDKVVFTKM